jgi:hypothetical protein
LNETTERTRLDNNKEIRTMVNKRVFGAFAEYAHDMGLTHNAVSRMAITEYLRDKGYLKSEAQE